VDTLGPIPQITRLLHPTVADIFCTRKGLKGYVCISLMAHDCQENLDTFVIAECKKIDFPDELPKRLN